MELNGARASGGSCVQTPRPGTGCWIYLLSVQGALRDFDLCGRAGENGFERMETGSREVGSVMAAGVTTFLRMCSAF